MQSMDESTLAAMGAQMGMDGSQMKSMAGMMKNLPPDFMQQVPGHARALANVFFEGIFIFHF